MDKHVFFDLDGTLTDSGPGIIKSIKYALDKMNYEMDEFFDYRRFVGPPLTDSFSDFCGFTGEDNDKAVAYYRERYSDKGLYENELYPGIISLLAKLRRDGYKCYVATTKPEVFAKKIIDHFKLTEYFEIIAGSLMDGTRNTKYEVIKHLLKEAAIEDVNNVVMVGDRKFDVEGAKSAGIDTIGVTYGYGNRKELAVAGACRVANDTEALYNVITCYF